MFKKISAFFAICLLTLAAGGICCEAEPDAPVFSADGGIYTESLSLTLSGGGDIYYTIDGSVPTVASTRYTEPIVIKDSVHSPRTVQSRVSQQRFGRGTVIRAAVIDAMGNKSSVVTNTYFVSEEVKSIASTVKVFALTAEPKELWDGKNGIYSNYEQDKKISAYVECIDKDGENGGFDRGIEMKIGGHYSKVNPKKSLRLYFTKGDSNEKKLEYDLIEGTTKNFYDTSAVKKYGKVTFRISDWSDTDLRDVIAQRMTGFLRCDSANSEPAAVYINGEFWGIYELREQYDNRYLDYHYEGVDKDDVVFIDRDWTNDNSDYILSDNGEKMTDRFTYDEGPEEDEEYYKDLFNYTKYMMEHASEGNNYRELGALVDIDNLIDYIFVYTYSNNIDWPGNNYKTWRTTIERSNGDTYAADGKWRFMVHDFDIAYDNPENDTLEYAVKSSEPDDNARQPAFAARTLDGLFKVEEFRTRFAQRAAAYMATAASPENMGKIIDTLLDERSDVKTYDLLRWNNMRGTSAARLGNWQEKTENLFNSFFERRAESFDDIVISFLRKNYESPIGETTDFTYNIDSKAGSLDIDGAIIREDFYGDKAKSFTTKQFTNIPLTITAEPKDGYKVESIVISSGNESETYQTDSVTITPEKKSYTVTVNMTEGETEPEEVRNFAVVREKRFLSMAVGEKLPIDIVSDSGEKLFGFSCALSGDAVELGENNIVKALKVGKATVSVTYAGIKKEISIEVK